jgi:hypothetical protein
MRSTRYKKRWGVFLVVLGCSPSHASTPVSVDDARKATGDLTQTVASTIELTLPVGTVVAFAGPLSRVPPGWLLCDGAALDSTEQKTLYQVIGTTYGDGVDMNGAAIAGKHFNVPDYRGVFLRGLDANTAGVATDRDPDRADRVARANSGARGNEVGSFQPDATRLPTRPPFMAVDSGTHTHTYQGFFRGAQSESSTFFHTIGQDMTGTTSASGAHGHRITGGEKETRPKNVSVYYIIYVGTDAR